MWSLYQSELRALRAVGRCVKLGAPASLKTLGVAGPSASTTGGTVAHVTQKQILAVLDSNKYSYNVGHASFVLQCPFCGGSQRSGGRSMFLNKTTGGVVCKPCDVRGSWADFLSWAAQSKPAPPSRRSPSPSSTTSSSSPSPLPPSDRQQSASRKEAQVFWRRTQPWLETAKVIQDQARRVFGIKKLLPAHLKKYSIHTVKTEFHTPSGRKEVWCVAYPWCESGEVVRVKVEAISESLPRQTALQPPEGLPGLFGWNTISKDAKEVVITGGEFDAIAVHQATHVPAVALPSGTVSLPPEVLPQLEQFEKVYLWLGGEVTSRLAASHFSRKLGPDRCYLVCAQERTHTALTALAKGHDLKSALKNAKPFINKQIVTFQQLREDVYSELCNANQVAGVKWQRFPKLTQVLKGHRSGELTVFTGATGTGKTTLISELSLDLCQQGVATLWGSFEIRNVRLAKMMMKQFSGLDLERHIKQYGYWANQFQQLPLYFMGFYGAIDISTVIETMAHAVYVYDIQHVIVDNLQFMLGSNLHSSLDRFSVQNQAVAEFRRFASAQNVHVTLVIHPRKENEANELTISSIFGTAKATQEADNVLILQSPPGPAASKFLQVAKNRFDGDLGRVGLTFRKDSLTLSGFPKEKKVEQVARSDFAPPSLRNNRDPPTQQSNTVSSKDPSHPTSLSPTSGSTPLASRAMSAKHKPFKKSSTFKRKPPVGGAKTAGSGGGGSGSSGGGGMRATANQLCADCSSMEASES